MDLDNVFFFACKKKEKRILQWKMMKRQSGVMGKIYLCLYVYIYGDESL